MKLQTQGLVVHLDGVFHEDRVVDTARLLQSPFYDLLSDVLIFLTAEVGEKVKEHRVVLRIFACLPREHVHLLVHKCLLSHQYHA